ncbi:MAG: hypothetical protein JWO61_321 [Candidatus Saccharibacteria bacterium]|nr:hypothetical protein [Candidatus Saccharibacteria bacterium]
MTTTLVVERIDIIEGPNLDELLRGLKLAVAREQGLSRGLSITFQEAVFFGGDGVELIELGRLFQPQLVGIRYLGNEATPSTRDDFVITVRSWQTFEGHYNTHTRKGSLRVL